jgi:hypothetical protein
MVYFLHFLKFTSGFAIILACALLVLKLVPGGA